MQDLYIDKVVQCCMTFVGTVKGPDPEVLWPERAGFSPCRPALYAFFQAAAAIARMRLYFKHCCSPVEN